MELDDEEDDMVAVEVPNMWSKGKGVQDASRDPSQDNRNTVEIIDDQDVQSVNNEDNDNKAPKGQNPIHIDSKQQSKTNSQNKPDALNTKDKPSGKKKAKKSSQVKEEIFKALEYDFESGKSNFTILIEPKTEDVVKNETIQNQDNSNA